MNIFDLNDRKILVAGAKGLIGIALCDTLRAHNATVIDGDIREGKDGVYLNLADNGTSLQQILSQNVINGFINVTYPRDFKTHTIGWLRAMRMIAEHMYEYSIGGSIVNFSSIYGLVGVNKERYKYTGGMTIPTEEYALIKGGIIAASKMMATEFAQYGIRINTIAPGGVWHHQPETFVKRYVADTPMGRMATPDDLVGTVIYLLSDASKYVTGICIPVDGGYSSL